MREKIDFHRILFLCYSGSRIDQNLEIIIEMWNRRMETLARNKRMYFEILDHVLIISFFLLKNCVHLKYVINIKLKCMDGSANQVKIVTIFLKRHKNYILFFWMKWGKFYGWFSVRISNFLVFNISIQCVLIIYYSNFKDLAEIQLP